MSSSSNGALNNKAAKLNSSNKTTGLNPNAEEFVPFALRSITGSDRVADATRLDINAPSGKMILDRSESSKSNNSDDDIHQFWRRQLPDDIIPDFTVTEKDEWDPKQLPLSDMSLNPGVVPSNFSVLDSKNFKSSEEMGYNGPAYSHNNSQARFLPLATNSWDYNLINDVHSTNGKEGSHFGTDYSAGFVHSSSSENAIEEDAATDPLEYLVSQFPGFSAESLVDLYYANGFDLNLTIEILTQLEMQVDGSSLQNMNPTSIAPSFSVLEFPALSEADNQIGLPEYNLGDAQGASGGYRSSLASGGAVDYVSAVRKFSSKDASNLKFEKKSTEYDNIGPSRGLQVASRQYSSTSKSGLGTKSQSVWLETGDAVANMYSESREEARDYARLRNACFEQATQAYLVGNKALAKELSIKGHVYDLQMKSAHGKAKEAIYRQRNPGASESHGYGKGQIPMIDLHGLHVTEAIQILKHELGILRRTARSTGQRIPVMICVGTGHHTKGSRTPARLPVAVEQFLLDEGLHYTQPQPGLLRVVMY